MTAITSEMGLRALRRELLLARIRADYYCALPAIAPATRRRRDLIATRRWLRGLVEAEAKETTAR